MRNLLAVAAAVVGGALLVTEATMRPTPADRVMLVAIYLTTAAVTVGWFELVRRLSGRGASVRFQLRLLAVGSVAVPAVAVVLAARSMFLSDHDRNLVLVALLLGAGLGTGLATLVSRSIADDLDRVAGTAGRFASGDHDARVRLGRRDEIGEVARAFDRMADRLAATEEERAVLLASIGHDLRTPLASLRATIEAVDDGVVDDPREAIAGMAGDVHHLSRLVDDLFLFARIEAGTLDLHPEPVDLAELAEDVVGSMRPLARRAEVTLGREGEGPVSVEADPSSLARVLRNILDNAVRHCPSGGAVRVGVERHDGWAVVRVVDDGPGFPEELRERVFTRFVRGDVSRSREAGAGLGLSIAKGLAEANGGDVVLEDGPGGRVAVRLPLRARPPVVV